MRTQRKKSPPKKAKFPQKAPKNNYFKTMMETPEGRELRKQWAKKRRKNPGRPKGTPDGYRKAEIEPIRKQAKKDAERIVEIMTDKMDLPEDEYSQEAMKTAVEIMRVPGSPRERLSAARLVLDFTKAKPASKAELSISKAEDFLSSLLEEDEHGQEVTTGQEETTN